MCDQSDLAYNYVSLDMGKYPVIWWSKSLSVWSNKSWALVSIVLWWIRTIGISTARLAVLRYQWRKSSGITRKVLVPSHVHRDIAMTERVWLKVDHSHNASLYWHRIERSLRDHIMTLRSHLITRWNRHCSRILQSILPMLEGHQSSPSQDCYEKLTEFNASYQVRT